MTEVLNEISNALATVVENAERSVVRVAGRRRGGSTGVVWSEGVVVTASHVIEWDEDIELGLPDGGSARAALVGRDLGTDLAVLKMDSGSPAPAPWREPDGLRAGNLVLSLSRPGQRVRARLGMVIVRGDAWWTPAGGRIEADVRLDLALHPGFSGSLVADAAGTALGIATAGIVRGTPTLVPAITLRRVVDAILAHGRVRRGFLGIGTQPVRLPANWASTLAQPAALLIVSVQPKTPAAQASLMLGDVLVSCDGDPVRHPGDLLPHLDAERIGQETVLKILRAGRLEEVRITVGEMNGETE
jgi:S1-C subfamily serine protease